MAAQITTTQAATAEPVTVVTLVVGTRLVKKVVATVAAATADFVSLNHINVPVQHMHMHIGTDRSLLTVHNALL